MTSTIGLRSRSTAAGGERFGYESAQPVMFGTVEAQDVRGGPLPQGTGGDALCLEAQPVRR